MSTARGRDDYTALICITTCRRLAYLERHLAHFAQLSAQDPRFSLIVAIDGTEPDTLDFCTRWRVPAVYADARAGVGISKNRALSHFGEFDYYFFIEDDVELVDGSALPAHVDLFKQSGIHHFSLFVRDGARKPVGTSRIAGITVVHCLFGAASVNFFTREGLARVGGWHPLFATYCRWGHTEHSYRFARTGLAPAPFNVAEDLIDGFVWHVPPAVTRISGVQFDDDQIAAPERELMERHLTYVPVQTLGPVHVNDVPLGQLAEVAAQLDAGNRYPLVDGTERRHARSDYNLWRFRNGGTRSERALALLAAIGRWPGNPALRHALKTAVSK